MRKRKVKPRAWIVRAMRLGTKPGAFLDRKKERNKKACRKFRRRDRYED